MRLSALRLIPVLVGLVALSHVWALLAFSQAGAPSLAGDVASSVRVDSPGSGAVIDERRLHFGKIFLGTVVGVTGVDVVSTSDPTESLPVILYGVDVSQSVRGNVEGRIEIWYYDFNGQSSDIAEYRTAGPLQVGARYLFFAGFDPIEDIYPVSDGVGVIPIHNDRKAARLIGTIEPLLEAVVQEDAEELSRYACGRVGRPELTVSPEAGQSGDRVKVSGTGRGRSQASVWWTHPGRERLAAVIIPENCAFTVEVSVPNAAPGEHRIVVLDALGQRSSTSFSVVPALATPAAQRSDPQRDFDQSQVKDDDRAYHGAIFIARVDALQREQLRVSEGIAQPFHVQDYLATVERVLAGTASDQVQIEYTGAYDNTPETQGFGPLRIGERYLFFADSAEIGPGYTVQAGSGAILITSDEQELELVDHYRPLIAEAAADAQVASARATATAEAMTVQAETEKAWAEARAARAGIAPAVIIEPERGLPGTRVLVFGEGVGSPEVTVSCGARNTSANVALGDGYFQTVIKIPRNAQSGVFPITVDDRQGNIVQVAFTVTD